LIEVKPLAMPVVIEALAMDMNKTPRYSKVKGLPTNTNNSEEVFHGERHKQFRAYQVEMSIPCSICTEVSKNDSIWRDKSRHRENITKTV
jgi:succinate dehydrogenase/fumarate reductase-like Fe-S protein